MKFITDNSRRARAGFSLVEILVVLVIASILAAVTLGGYSAMRASNRRTSCQANMAQIYQAIRLYATDYDGQVPYYNPAPANQATIGQGQGLGLWALFTYANDSDPTIPADANIKPEKRYLSNPKLFHCPSDNEAIDDQLYVPGSSNSVYNPGFLSYQPEEKDTYMPIADPDNGQYIYNPIRTTTIGANWQRQLLTYNGSTYVQRPPTDDTVVLWCPFHRGGGGASSDNVLFWDGTVQSLPEDQDGKTGADRTPKTP